MPLIRACLGFAGLALLLNPLFFVILRLAAFNTVPHDDYAPYLLWLLGTPPGFFPDSPFCYRILSVAAAVPFYVAMPVLRLTNLPADMPAELIRANQAMSAVAFCAWIVGTMAIFACARRLGLRRGDSVLAGGLLGVLGLYVQYTSIDAPLIALIAGGVALLHRPGWFALLVILGSAANEKLGMVLAVWLTLRCLTSAEDRRLLWRQWAAASLACALYVAVVAVLRFPGNAWQHDPAAFLPTLAANLALYLSPRGVALNLLPMLVLAGLAVFGHAGRAPAPFRRTDLLMLAALPGIGLVLAEGWQAGRLAMFAAPIFVIPAVAAARDWLAATGDHAA